MFTTIDSRALLYSGEDWCVLIHAGFVLVQINWKLSRLCTCLRSKSKCGLIVRMNCCVLTSNINDENLYFVNCGFIS